MPHFILSYSNTLAVKTLSKTCKYTYFPSALESVLSSLNICRKLLSCKYAEVIGFDASLGIRSGLQNGLSTGTLLPGPIFCICKLEFILIEMIQCDKEVTIHLTMMMMVNLQ